MRSSAQKILTTHVGSLPNIQPIPDDASEAVLREAVTVVVARQREIGVDIVNEGEYTKGGDWLSYIGPRFSGFTPRERPAGERPLLEQGKDREKFAAFYKYAAERGTLFFNPGEQIQHSRRPIYVCTGPIAYTGQAALKNEIDLLLQAAGDKDVFLTSTAPASIEVYRRNEHYRSEEEYLYALADALAVEYRLIAESGAILQVDDAWLPALWDRIGIDMGLEAFRKRCAIRIEALNHALKGIPEDRIRYHLCWGSWHGPHAFDIELRAIVDLMLQVKAQAYLIEGANARHEHEWEIWRDVKLPAGKILIPGVVTHSTDIVEHPELVAQRLRRYASVVGKENLIAGTDCGFGGRSHPQIGWAKLESLVEGARLASASLY